MSEDECFAPVADSEDGALYRQKVSDWEAHGLRLCFHANQRYSCGTCGIAHRAARPAPVADPKDGRR